MINLFNLKNSILAWVFAVIGITISVFKIRKGGADAQKLKTEQQTNEQIIAVQKRIHEAGYVSNDDVRDSLRKNEF